ncbi:MAG TPA: PHP domain-containing protein [Candidatus Paceibacterota bacterium]|nr:PHP domain-containing protein [Candidatus Paceibacterota bacterium]
MIESLHNHTTASDGRLSHKELFSLAEQLGVGVLAYTDHDALPDDNALKFLESVRDRKTKWIIGMEITASLPDECYGHTGTIHVVGLFLDPHNEALREHARKAQEARIERMQIIVRKLSDLGFMISEQDCLKESGGESVGRVHIAAALESHPENGAVLQHLMLQMEVAGRTDKRIGDKYARMIAIGPRQYIYDVCLSPDAFKPAYVEARYTPDIDEATTLIRHAGGMSFIAHYSYERKKLPMETVRALLRENRVDGVEVVYGAGMKNTSEAATFEEDKIALRTLCTLYGRQISGGADAHSTEDLERYAADKSFSGESKGLAAKIIATGQVEVRNSSITITS